MPSLLKVADRPHFLTISLGLGALVVSLVALVFSGLQYRANTRAMIVQQRPWLNLENSSVSIADTAATFNWKNRGRTPALDVESHEWDVLGNRSDGGFKTVYTSEKRHIRYSNIWLDGTFRTATLAPSAAKLPEIQGANLRLLGMVTYKDFFNANVYHVYYCLDVVQNLGLFPCPEPELNRVD